MFSSSKMSDAPGAQDAREVGAAPLGHRQRFRRLLGLVAKPHEREPLPRLTPRRREPVAATVERGHQDVSATVSRGKSCGIWNVFGDPSRTRVGSHAGDRAATVAHPPGGRRLEPGDDIEERALAGAVRADDAQDLALGQAKSTPFRAVNDPSAW